MGTSKLDGCDGKVSAIEFVSFYSNQLPKVKPDVRAIEQWLKVSGRCLSAADFDMIESSYNYVTLIQEDSSAGIRAGKNSVTCLSKSGDFLSINQQGSNAVLRLTSMTPSKSALYEKNLEAKATLKKE